MRRRRALQLLETETEAEPAAGPRPEDRSVPVVADRAAGLPGSPSGATEHRGAESPGAAAGPLPRALPWLLLGGGAVGLLAAAALIVEKIALIADPTHRPSCSINPVLSCGSVMTTDQASAFGIPNALIGVAAFAVVATSGATLLAGARPRAWYWAGLQVGVLFGAGFVHWLIFQSLYRIGALCPYCMVVWSVTVPIAWYVTLRNLAAVDEHLPRPVRGLARSVNRVHSVPLTLWFITVVSLILHRFWYFWTG